MLLRWYHIMYGCIICSFNMLLPSDMWYLYIFQIVVVYLIFGPFVFCAVFVHLFGYSYICVLCWICALQSLSLCMVGWWFYVSIVSPGEWSTSLSNVETTGVTALQFIYSCFVIIIDLVQIIALVQTIVLVEVFSYCVLCFVGYFVL